MDLVLHTMLFCLSGLLTHRLIKAGWRDHLGHVIIQLSATLLILLAISLNWNSPLSLALQSFLAVGPYLTFFSVQRAIQRAMIEKDLEKVLTLARLQCHLFPFEVHRSSLKLYEALDARGREDQHEALELMAHLLATGNRPGLESTQAYAQVTALGQKARARNWRGVIEQLTSGSPLPAPYRFAAQLLKVRAHCELGQLTEALAAFKGWEALRFPRHIRQQVWLSALNIVSLGGRRKAAEHLLQHALRHLDLATSVAWMARAAWGAGAVEESRILLNRLIQREDLPESIRQELTERRDKLETPPPPVSPQDAEELTRIERWILLESRILPDLGETLSQRTGTRAIVAALLAVQAALWVVGDPARVLGQFGALGLLWLSEPWRILTSLFLQTDGFHTLALLSLSIWLGGTVEGALGRGRAVLIFVSCGVLGQLVGMWMLPQVQLVGADAAVMGWLGARGVISYGYPDLTPGQRVGTRANLLLAVGVIALRALFHPHTSVATVLAGLLLGAGLGLLFLRGTIPSFSPPLAQNQP